MNYKKFTNNAYNLHIISTDKFKTIMIKINFKRKLKKEDITYRNLLTKALLESNKNYPSKRDLEIETEELYNLGVSGENSISGNYMITSFNGFFLNDKYTENNLNEESIKFIIDLIFNPDIKNKAFVQFELAKRLVEQEIKSITDDPRKYSLIRLFENMNVSYNPMGYQEDLNKITATSLYKYYLEMLKSDLIDIFVIGDIDSGLIKKQVSNAFTVNTIKKQPIKHFVEHNKIRSRAKTVIEDMPLQQSKLNIGIRLDPLTEFEKKYVSYIYTFILGGGPDSKLFQNVREKNSLCYNIHCANHPVLNMLVISAGINKKDFKKCIAIIKKEIAKMAKGAFEANNIQAAIITYISSLKDIEDFEPSIIKIFESHEYLDFDLLDERANNIINVTKEDIINFSKKIHLDTIYLLGGTDEKN